MAHLCNLNIMNDVSSAILDRDMVSVLLVMTIIYNIFLETKLSYLVLVKLLVLLLDSN